MKSAVYLCNLWIVFFLAASSRVCTRTPGPSSPLYGARGRRVGTSSTGLPTALKEVRIEQNSVTSCRQILTSVMNRVSKKLGQYFGKKPVAGVGLLRLSNALHADPEQHGHDVSRAAFSGW